MDVTPEQFVDALLSDEAYEEPSDTAKPEELVIELPKWYDEEMFNRGRKFYWSHCFAFSTSMLLGLVAVFSVPSILRILVSTRRANSVFTAYRRYLSTLLHTISWFEHPLKPGSISWKSLYTVRSRHLRAGLASRLKNLGTVNQRDIALTQFGFIGFSLVQSDKLGIRQLQTGDWEAYNHFWRVIGHMIGLDDRYNICRSTVEETREVCNLLLERVFTPCLENVPEHFEHSARVMLDGMWSVNPTIEENSTLYFTRYLAKVPGYIYTESDRVEFQKRLRQELKGRSLDEGVSSRSLISKCAVSGLPDLPPKQLYLRDYDSLETTPTYQQLSFKSKFKLNSAALAMAFYNTYLGRLYFNLNFLWSLVLMKYFPYLAFFRFGFRASYPKLFQEDPTDDSVPVPNSEYYKPQPPSTWYEDVWAVIW